MRDARSLPCDESVTCPTPLVRQITRITHWLGSGVSNSSSKLKTRSHFEHNHIVTPYFLLSALPLLTKVWILYLTFFTESLMIWTERKSASSCISVSDTELKTHGLSDSEHERIKMWNWGFVIVQIEIFNSVNQASLQLYQKYAIQPFRPT